MRKLDAIIEAIAGKERVLITRLTVVKKLCEDTEAARTSPCSSPGKPRGGCVRRRARGDIATGEPGGEGDEIVSEYAYGGWEWPLLDLLREIKEEQNEYEPISWGVVRNIDCWDLLVVEKALQGFTRPEEAKHWLYQATRDHVGSSEVWSARSRRIEEIARFWRRYFKGKARQG